MGLRVANRPVQDSEGFASAVISRCEFGKGQEVVKKSRDDVDTREYERLEIDLTTEGTNGPIQMSIYTGTALNGVIEEVGRGKNLKKVYNRLTTIALGLGLVKPDELEGVISDATVERVSQDLMNLKGTKIKFKLGKVEGKNLTVPIPDTIRKM